MNGKRTNDAPLFETSGVLDVAFYEEVNAYLLPKKNRAIVFACIGVCLVFFILGCGIRSKVVMAYSAVIILGLCLLYAKIWRRCKRLTYRNKDKNEKPFTMRAAFYEQEIRLESELFEKDAVSIGYQEVYQIKKLQNFYLLFVLGKPLVVVFRKGFAREEEWLSFLEGKRAKERQIKK